MRDHQSYRCSLPLCRPAYRLNKTDGCITMLAMCMDALCFFFTISGLGQGTGFCRRSRIPNKDLPPPNKCPPQSVIDHLLLPLLLSSSALTLSVLSFSLIPPLLCVRWHYRGEYLFLLVPLFRSELRSFHVQISPTVLLPSSLLSPAPLSPHSLLSLHVIPENWTHSDLSLRPNGIFSLSYALICSASLNPRESIIN